MDGSDGRDGGLSDWGVLGWGVFVGVAVVALLVAAYAIGARKDEADSIRAENAATQPATAPAATEPAPADTAAAATFAATCGGCHALAASGTAGTVGPSLDSLAPSVEQVLAAIEGGGAGSGQMPAGLLSGDEARQVAEYVAASAGSGG